MATAIAAVVDASVGAAVAVVALAVAAVAAAAAGAVAAAAVAAAMHLPSLLLSLPSCLGYVACYAACHAVCQGAWRIRFVWFKRRMRANARAREGQSIVGGLIGFDGTRTHMHSKICDDKSDAREQLLTVMGAPGS